MTPAQAVSDVVATAIGRVHRNDPALPRTGGPAGNARLTAWLGLMLLVLSLAELVTLLSLDQLVSWHIVIGVLLVPPALVKTASTGWRIVRYYAGSPSYRRAGPPPMLLRLLGPLVVAGTLAVLGSGIALVALGADTTRQPFATILGHGISPLTVHQACFAVWAVATGLHVLGRLVPAARLASGGPVTRLDGRTARIVVLALTVAVGALTAALVLGHAGSWTSGTLLHHHEWDDRFNTPTGG